MARNKNANITITTFLAKCQYGMGSHKLTKNVKPGREWVHVGVDGVGFGSTRDEARKNVVKESEGSTNENESQVA